MVSTIWLRGDVSRIKVVCTHTPRGAESPVVHMVYVCVWASRRVESLHGAIAPEKRRQTQTRTWRQLHIISQEGNFQTQMQTQMITWRHSLTRVERSKYVVPLLHHSSGGLAGQTFVAFSKNLPICTFTLYIHFKYYYYWQDTTLKSSKRQ